MKLEEGGNQISVALLRQRETRQQYTTEDTHDSSQSLIGTQRKIERNQWCVKQGKQWKRRCGKDGTQ